MTSSPLPDPAPEAYPPPRSDVLVRAASAYRVHSSRIAAALLVITNLIPLAGVLWFGWDLLLIMALYWAENGVLGVINIGKILLAEGPPPANFKLTINGRPATSLSRTGTAGFFCMHYGIFWVVHGVFVFTLIPALTGETPFAVSLNVPLFLGGVVALAISHGTSFWLNYVGRGEYRTISAAEVMTQPYGRLVILHVTIVLGAFVSIQLGTPIGSLLVLVLLKTGMDLYFHLRQHREPAGAKPVIAD
jgi:hypothetical protein